ncbi:hypothetical protein QQS21_002098 [Conoideocrella luteorostrata]|uniref:Uncharacterized protein n=1 Tax=Conoideocrella luteorostrata TaxID=1105319 RepID=A0AAJ0FWU9_9HYPO|nr:hypothetical protein QQS21_002098 [Conoideocrella luteorostrata]
MQHPFNIGPHRSHRERMERSFDVRINGIYKKANDLFHGFGTRIAILRETNDGRLQGYTPLGSQDWPELYRAVEAVGLQSEEVLHPHHFNTIADHNVRLPSPAPSSTSSSVSSIPNNASSEADNDHANRHPAQTTESVTLHAASGSQEPITPSTTQLQELGELEDFEEDLMHGSSTVSSVRASDQVKQSRIGAKRKIACDDGPEEKRRRIVTRSRTKSQRGDGQER